MAENKTPEVLALIPARGGSKGIPGKNIKLFRGHPLIAWSIFAARESKLITRIIVSTDDADIAYVAEQYDRVERPFIRPAELAQDDTLDLPVFQHALGWLEWRKYVPDLVVHLRPTSPVRPPGIIDEAIQIALDHPEADSVRSVTVARQNPFKMWLLDPFRPVIDYPQVPEAYNAPRQSLPQAYMHLGVVDVIRPRAIWAGSMSGNVILPIVFPPEYDIDLDTLDDWERASRIANP